MLNARMLYKYPGKHEIHGDKFDYIVVPEHEVDVYLAKGWHLTTDDAKGIEKKPKPEPESVKVNLNAEPEKPKKKLFDDLTDEEKSKIARSKLSVAKLVKKYKTTSFTVRKVKRLKDELDKTTTSESSL